MRWSRLLVQLTYPEQKKDESLFTSSKQIKRTHPSSTRLNLMRSSDSPVDVLREYSTRQAVLRIVGLLNDILIVVKLDQHTDRPENLLLDNLHIWLGIGEDSRLNEVAFVSVAFATLVYRCTLSFA